MLDGVELAKRLRDAMDKREPRLTSAALADSCKVTAQAVNGWRKTGRIAKKHLPKIAAETGRPLSFFLEERPGTVVTNFGLVLSLEEAEAMKRLQTAIPDWRRYIISLAMTTDHRRQRLFLDMLAQHVPDEAVAAAYGSPARKK